MDANVLIVDRDASWRARVAQALAEEAVAVSQAENGAEALEQAKAAAPDLLLTELDLPDVTGLGLIRTLREEPILAHVPVIVVTRFDREVDRIVAFETGIDDYVTKPFFGRELAGRVRAVLRRSARRPAAGAETSRPSTGGIALDADGRSVRVDGDPVTLTPREFDLLATLMNDAGRVMSRGRLVEHVWGDDTAAGHRSVDTHVKTIRRKLGARRRCIETVRGVGYRFNER